MSPGRYVEARQEAEHTPHRAQSVIQSAVKLVGRKRKGSGQSLGMEKNLTKTYCMRLSKNKKKVSLRFKGPDKVKHETEGWQSGRLVTTGKTSRGVNLEWRGSKTRGSDPGHYPRSYKNKVRSPNTICNNGVEAAEGSLISIILRGRCQHILCDLQTRGSPTSHLLVLQMCKDPFTEVGTSRR